MQYLHPKKLFYLVAGSLLMAITINLLIASNDLAFGGVTGVAIILALFAIPLGVTFWALSIPLFILSVRIRGLAFTTRSIFATSLVAFFLFVTTPLQQVTSHVMFAAIVGGVLLGLSVAMIIHAGGSTGGTPMVACLLKRYLPLRASIIILDGSVITTGAVIFGVEKALYSIILVICLAQTVEYMTKILGTNFDPPDDHGSELSLPSSTKSTSPTG